RYMGNRVSGAVDASHYPVYEPGLFSAPGLGLDNVTFPQAGAGVAAHTAVAFAAAAIPGLAGFDRAAGDPGQRGSYAQTLGRHLSEQSGGTEEGMAAALDALRSDPAQLAGLAETAQAVYLRDRAEAALGEILPADLYGALPAEELGAMEGALAARMSAETDGTPAGITAWLGTLDAATLPSSLLDASAQDAAEGTRYISLFGDPDFSLTSLQDAFRYMGNRVSGAVDASHYPVYEPGMEDEGLGVEVRLRQITPRENNPDQPILNWINENVLQSGPVRAFLQTRGIRDVYVAETGLRLGTTYPFDQRRQFMEIDDAARLLRKGVADIAGALRSGDMAQVKAAWADLKNELYVSSDLAFRPNRGTLSEPVQAPAFDQAALLGITTALGEILPALPPTEAARSLFVEMSLKNNQQTGGIVEDPDAPSGYRMNVARDEATGEYVVLKPIVMKSILQFETFSQLPEAMNPMQVPFVGGIYPSLEVRTMDYVGPNAGYWVIPPGQRLTERQVALLQEGIVDPALFSENGNLPDAWRPLFRGFESDSLFGLNVQNRNDHMTGLAPEARPATGEPYRTRMDFEFGADVLVTPTAGTPLAPFGGYIGFSPFRMGGGAVVKADVFPEPPGVGRVITMNDAGEIVDRPGRDGVTLRNRTFENRPDGLTTVFVPPELQSSPNAMPDEQIVVNLPSQTAFALVPEIGRWGRHSEEATLTWLSALSDDADPGVSAAASRALVVWGRQPANPGSRITEDQRTAIGNVVTALIDLYQRAEPARLPGAEGAPGPDAIDIVPEDTNLGGF
ncbi:MAG: hypothetical protein LPL00_04045, partial [Alphaproteobacteria bacterium]|nr:hypothetical protein [Alphaproteobacteria bacterium]MDX5368663.1 hypothetical protein [Alphaproteobacteria bacterium]MDX5463408.1 hypothetical protein [Alphaproteobacteria bacterium]